MTRTFAPLWRCARSALVAVALVAPAAHAHPIHTTLTVVTTDATGIALNIRAFADDFSATVAKFAGKRAPADSSAPDADVLRYVRAQFAVKDASGASIELQPCGIRRAAELYWLCFKAVLPRGVSGALVRNQMLTELHSDQVNIVQVEGKRARKTLLFTKGSAPSPIGSA